MNENHDKCVVCRETIVRNHTRPLRVCDLAVCQQSYRNHLNQAGKICVVCGAMVQSTPTTKPVTCHSQNCQRQAASWRGADEAFCRVCGIHLTSNQRAEGICAQAYCRQQLTVASAAQKSQRLNEKRERLEYLAMSQWFTSGQGEDVSSSQTLHQQCPLPIVVPANRRPLSTPPVERIAILRENLVRLVETAASEASTMEHSSAELAERFGHERETEEAFEAEKADSNFDVLVGHACGTCLGFCCFAGREHAFLKVSDVRRTMTDKHIVNVETVVDEFLSHIPDQTVEGSCLFHGPQGCGMPRRMRSDMCNTTLCPSLVNLYHKSAGQAEAQSYLMAATNVEDDLDPEPRVFALKVAKLLTTS